MWSSLSAWVLDVFLGLFLAGLISGLLVPAMGGAAHPTLLFAVAIACVTAVLTLRRRRRRRGEGE
jgi:hypothetical protein